MDLENLDSDKYVCKLVTHHKESNIEDIHIIIGDADDDTLERYIGNLFVNNKDASILAEYQEKAGDKKEITLIQHEVHLNGPNFKEHTEVDFDKVSVSDLIEANYFPSDFSELDSYKALVNSFEEAGYTCYLEDD